MLGKTNSMVQGGGDSTSMPIAAIHGHVSTGNAWDVPTNYLRYAYDDDFFSYESGGIFTAKKACTVEIVPILNQMYNQNTGSSNTGTCEIRVNGTSIWTGTRNNPQSTNSFATQTVALSVGDTVQYRCHGSTTAYITGGMFIRLAS